MLKVNKKAVQKIKVEHEDEGYSIFLQKQLTEDCTDSALTNLRKSIVGWSDVLDEESKPLPFNEENQKLVFEAILEDDEFFKKVCQEFSNDPVNLKNLKVGATV
jgi:hypothetical protein